MSFKSREALAAYHKKWRAANKAKSKVYQQTYQKKHPERVKARHRKSRYGITAEDFEKMRVEQGGVCAICGLRPEMTPRGIFVVDHDHETEIVRALLCNNCNVAVSLVGESIATATALLNYLLRHKGRT